MTGGRTMNPEKMTTTLQSAIAEAQQVAINTPSSGDRYSLIYGKFYCKPINLAAIFIRQRWFDVDAFEKEVDRLLDEIPSVEGGKCSINGQSMSQNLFRLLSDARDPTKKEFNDEYLSTEVVL